MFDIGWGELLVIGIVALIAIGPKELPTVLRTLGQYMGKVRRMAAEFQGQFQDALREAEVADLKKQAEDLTSSVTDFPNFDPLAKAKNEIENVFAEPPAADSATGTAVTADAEPPPLPAIDVSLPEPPAPLTEKDVAPPEPATSAEPPASPPKQAGGSS